MNNESPYNDTGNGAINLGDYYIQGFLMDNTIIASLIGVVGGLIGAWIGGIISRKAAIEASELSNNNAIKIMKRQEFFTAASKYKASIIYELPGFYPSNQYWDKDNFDRLYKSIPHIMSAAAEFRFFVKSKDAFDDAIKAYDEYCRKTTYDQVAADTMYPAMKKPGELGKREQFKNIVAHLISFADEI
jgi:hypothetical protein